MIEVTPPPEPADFNEICRGPGNKILAKTPPVPHDKLDGLWTPFTIPLAKGFNHRCGWLAMRIVKGEVDHYMSKSKDANRYLVYEWSNYRYIESTINKYKRTRDDRVLDPFDIESGWFKVILPSFQLIRTDAVPVDEIVRAKYTLEKLHLIDEEWIIDERQRWYADYYHQECTLSYLETNAPLVATAVRDWEATGRTLPPPPDDPLAEL
jgi:hypothetical protein